MSSIGHSPLTAGVALKLPRPKTAKLAEYGALREYVAEKSRDQWSLKQISHTLRVDYPEG